MAWSVCLHTFLFPAICLCSHWTKELGGGGVSQDLTALSSFPVYDSTNHPSLMLAGLMVSARSEAWGHGTCHTGLPTRRHIILCACD